MNAAQLLQQCWAMVIGALLIEPIVAGASGFSVASSATVTGSHNSHVSTAPRPGDILRNRTRMWPSLSSGTWRITYNSVVLDKPLVHKPGDKTTTEACKLVATSRTLGASTFEAGLFRAATTTSKPGQAHAGGRPLVSPILRSASTGLDKLPSRFPMSTLRGAKPPQRVPPGTGGALRLLPSWLRRFTDSSANRHSRGCSSPPSW